MIEEIKLEDLVPTGASFTLRKTGKTYRLNAISLGDEMWMQETFGEGLSAVFSKMKMKEVCRILFHQLVEEDKADFAATDVVFMNEEGETLRKRVGGAELLYIQVSGFAEKIEIFEALMQTLGCSRPVLEKLTGVEREKKSLQPTGPESLTFSRMSTPGQPNMSSRARHVNLRTEFRRLKKGRDKI